MAAAERHIEVLVFEGCPNAEPALELVERVREDLGIAATIDRVDVKDEGHAAELRFLGSPTIRVDGRDIEPGADERSDYVFSCRVYPSASGLTGGPDERWLRDALREHE
jgi:hypothetical protein